VNKRVLLDATKYLLAFGLLAWVIWRQWNPPTGIGLSTIWQQHAVEGKPVNWGYLGVALALFPVSIIVTLFRWFVLVRAVGLSVSAVEAFRVGLVGLFYNTLLPGSVGGDLVKAVAVARKQSRRTTAVATIIMDRVIALWGLVWFVALLGGAFWALGYLEGKSNEKAPQILVGAAVSIVAVSSVVWLLLGLLPDSRAERFAGRLEGIPRIGNSAAEFWRAVWMYHRRPAIVVLAILLSWINFTSMVGGFYCCSQAFYLGDPPNAVPSLVEHFLIVPAGILIMSLPLFPGGVGIGELGFGALYGWFGKTATFGSLASLVWRVLTWISAGIGYIISFYLPVAEAEKQTLPLAVAKVPVVLPEQEAAAG
jgi:glycosyltransferase 2 family protein